MNSTRYLSMRRIDFFIVLLVAFPLVASAETLSQSRIDKWEPAVQEFERPDADTLPKPGGVVFVGSSSIRFWKLNKWFATDALLNRGFGGSQIADSNYFIDRLVLKHKPRLIVFYAGDNDINAGLSAEKVAEDF